MVTKPPEEPSCRIGKSACLSKTRLPAALLLVTALAILPTALVFARGGGDARGDFAGDIAQ
jgi:hypothetical protein